MADVRQYRQDPQINHGTTAQNNLKLTDIMPVQHENLATQTNSINKINLAQCLCEPYALCNSNNPSSGNYTATCENFPDFALSYTDSQGNSHNLIGLKVRVKFTYGITYGSVSGGTYPTLNINGSGAIPMLAQGKTMATGAISAGQTVEFTIIPYGNGLAFDADSNVRESTSDYTIYTDGTIIQQPTDELSDGNTAPVASNAIYWLRRGLFYDTGLLSLSDNQEKTVTLNESRMYLYINVHALNGQELIILNCYNGVLKQTRLTHAFDNGDTVITNSGQNVTFKSTRDCRGHLLLLTDFFTS